jgi:putative restriction endonuclease
VFVGLCVFLCLSGLQLEIVEAAHIIPLAHEEGDNNIDNGICLSSLHHAAYDRGIIYFDEEFKILVNKNKINYLEKLGKDGGFVKFRDLNYDFIRLPEVKNHYPSKEKIKLANSLRGII